MFGAPHILQSDNGREFKNVNPATMIREKWPECKIIHGKARDPQSQGSVEGVNREIKKVLGSLMRKTNDPWWVKYVNLAQYSINTKPHSTLQNKTPTEFSSAGSLFKDWKTLVSPKRLLRM